MMSDHGANLIFINKKIRIGGPEHALTPHPPHPITSHFCLITPPTPQKGHHMCITPNSVLLADTSATVTLSHILTE